MSHKPILTTLDYPAREEWNREAEVVGGGRWAVVRGLVSGGRRGRVLVLDGSIGIRAKNPDLIAAVLLGLLPRRMRPRVVMAEANWKPGSGVRRLGRRVGFRLIARSVDVFCVVSRHEERVFADTWGIDPGRVVYTPFYWTLSDDEVADPGPPEGDAVFAGGNPMRDYGTLIEAVRGMRVPVTIATSRPEVVGHPDLPPNVDAGRLTHDEFIRRLRAAAVVAIPLQPGTARSGGEQTYLNAMALGKPVVVTDSPGVRDYVEDGVTGRIVPASDPAALREAIAWALAQENREAVVRMAAAARARAIAEFGPDGWVRSLLGQAHRLREASTAG
jgi:hypothetical protein